MDIRAFAAWTIEPRFSQNDYFMELRFLFLDQQYLSYNVSKGVMAIMEENIYCD